jgi:hypothetical protein
MLEEAIQIVLEAGEASASLLQRRMGVGYPPRPADGPHAELGIVGRRRPAAGRAKCCIDRATIPSRTLSTSGCGANDAPGLTLTIFSPKWSEIVDEKKRTTAFSLLGMVRAIGLRTSLDSAVYDVVRRRQAARFAAPETQPGPWQSPSELNAFKTDQTGAEFHSDSGSLRVDVVGEQCFRVRFAPEAISRRCFRMP